MTYRHFHSQKKNWVNAHPLPLSLGEKNYEWLDPLPEVCRAALIGPSITKKETETLLTRRSATRQRDAYAWAPPGLSDKRNSNHAPWLNVSWSYSRSGDFWLCYGLSRTIEIKSSYNSLSQVWLTKYLGITLRPIGNRCRSKKRLEDLLRSLDDPNCQY